MSSFTPVLLGTDLNAYSVALSFREFAGVKSFAFGRYPCGITSYSRFLRVKTEPRLLEKEVLWQTLTSFADRRGPARYLLIPCADWYVALLETGIPDGRFTAFLPPPSLFHSLSDKSSFLTLLDRFGVPHPKTVVFSFSSLKREAFACDIPYPAVLKPADSTAYWAHPFPGMQKVWYPATPAEAYDVAMRIYTSGYGGKLLLQEKIHATAAATLTVLADGRGEVVRAVRGRVLLEETAPTAAGNYSALVSAPLDDVSRRLIAFLRGVGYRGIGNFDILYDGERPFVLEMNPRQGRSCDFLRAAGVDLSGFLIRAAQGVPMRPSFSYPTVYWRCVKDAAVRRYAKDRTLLAEAEELRKCGFAFSPFHTDADLRFNPVRRLYVALHEIRRGAAFGGNV